MARGKVREYADGRLVAMLAGGHSYAEVAEATGLTEGYVGRVARGERRPAVLAEVRAQAAAAVEEARRVAARCSRELVARHVEAGLHGHGETARKCREFILCMCGLGPDGAAWGGPRWRDRTEPDWAGEGVWPRFAGWMPRRYDPAFALGEHPAGGPECPIVRTSCS